MTPPYSFTQVTNTGGEKLLYFGDSVGIRRICNVKDIQPIIITDGTFVAINNLPMLIDLGDIVFTDVGAPVTASNYALADALRELIYLGP
jgi:hypothetical protein